MSKAELLDLYRLGVDLMGTHRFAPDDLVSWPGRLLILVGTDFLALSARAELTLLPAGRRLHDPRRRHTPWMSHKDEYLSAVNEFLAGRVRSPRLARASRSVCKPSRRTHPYRRCRERSPVALRGRR